MNRLFTYLYAALLFVTPLVMSPRTSELFEFNKLLIIYLITGTVVSLWLARMILTRTFIVRRNVLLLPLIFFWLTQLLSTIFSIDIQTSLFGYYGRFNGGLLSITSYVLLFLAFISNIDISDKKILRATIDTLLKVSMISAFIVMLWGLPSHFGYDLTCYVFTGKLDVACWTAQFVPTSRVFSTLGQPNWLAAYLVIHIFFGVYYVLKEKILWRQVMYMGFVAFAMVMLMYTRSRSALLALVIGGLMIDVYIFIHRAEYFKKEMRKLLIGLSVAILVPFLLFGTNIEPITDIFSQDVVEEISPEATPEASVAPVKITDSGTIRKIVWQGAYGLGIEYPLFGTGVETFAYSYNFLRPVQHNDTSEWDFVYNKAHNEVFNYFATTGFLGLGGYLIVFALVVIQIRSVIAGELDKDDELLMVVLIASYIALFVTNFLGFSTTIINLFYYLIPVWIVLIRYGADMPSFIDSLSIDQEDALKLLVPAMIVLFVGWYVVQYYQADVAYAEGDGLRQAQEIDSSLPALYKAYDIRKEHIYEDRISQVLAQQALARLLAGEPSALCLDRDGSYAGCIDLANEYNRLSLEGSPMNVFYYRTQARNNFLFFQATQDESYYNQAIKSVDQARELAPTDPRLPYLRALFSLGKYEIGKSPTKEDKDRLELVGLSSAEFAIELKDDYVDAYYVKGLIQKELEDLQGARETFEYVIDNLEPHNQLILQELEGL